MSRHSVKLEDGSIADIEIPDKLSDDIPAIASSAVTGFIPGLREAVQTAPYALPQHNMLDLLPPTGPRQAFVSGSNMAADAANVLKGGLIDAPLETLQMAKDLFHGKITKPVDLQAAATQPIPRPFKTLDILPEAKTPAGKALAFAAEVGTGLMSGHMLNAGPNASKILAAKNAEAEYLTGLVKQAETSSNAVPAEIAQLRKNFETTIQNKAAGEAATVDRALVDYDKTFFDNAKDLVLKTRERAKSWIKNFEDQWGKDFEGLIQGKSLEPAEASGLTQQMYDQLGLDVKVNLTPGEAKIKRLWQAMQENKESVSLDRLYKELKTGFNPNSPDHAIGVAKQTMANYLAERGDKDIAAFRSTYGPYADFKNRIHAIVQPWGNPNDTKRTVNNLYQLMVEGSEIDPNKAKNVRDLQDFLEMYRKNVDPEVASQLQTATNGRRWLATHKVQAAAQAERRIIGKADFWKEMEKRASETAKDTVSRLTQQVQAATSSAERLIAQQKLNQFIKRAVWITGAGSLFEAGKGVSRVVGRTISRMAGMKLPEILEDLSEEQGS